MALIAMPCTYKIIFVRDWYIGCAQPSQGCERGPTPLSRSFTFYLCNDLKSPNYFPRVSPEADKTASSGLRINSFRPEGPVLQAQANGLGMYP